MRPSKNSWPKFGLIYYSIHFKDTEIVKAKIGYMVSVLLLRWSRTTKPASYEMPIYLKYK